MYIFPLILYPLSVLPLPRFHRMALKQSLSKLFWKGRSPMARRLVCYQRPRNEGHGYLISRATGSLKDWLTWADPCRGTLCGDKRRETSFFASSPIPRLKVIACLGMKHRSPASAVGPSVTFLGPVTFLGFKRNCIRS